MVTVPGGRAYVRVNGRLDGSRPPIVLIHGGPGSTHSGLLDALQLADDRAVIFYDQLDSGRSDRPNDPANWKVERFVTELEAIRLALGVERWHVAGFSWGGTIALEYAVRHPARLASVVLGSPLISTRSWIADANVLRAKLPLPVQSQLTACERPTPPPTEICEAATKVFYDHFLRRGPPSAAHAAYRHPADRGFNQRIYEQMWGKSEYVSTGTLSTYDGEPLLTRLEGKRTLFMVGQHDEARPATASAFAERVPGAELAVIPGAAHAVLQDRPDEALAVLRAWLNRQDKTPH